MFYKLFFLFLFTFLKDQANTADNETKGNQVDPKLNDYITEFFHNCTCIPYYICSEANRYMFVVRADILPKELICSNSNYLCCKNVTNPDPPEPKTEPSVTTTPETASVRNPFLNQRECGVAKTEIGVRILTPDTDSATTISGEVPWIVEIFQKRRNTYKLKCAGSLIHAKVVVTGTHCVASNKPDSLKIVATGLGHFQNVGINAEDERSVVKIIKHPQYYSGGLYNDIALLILDREYTFSYKFLNSICIPKPNQNYDGKTCIATGWGENPSLRNVSLHKVDVPVVDSAQCQDLLRKTSLGPDFDLHESFLCAGGEEGKDTCKGDGGGPLMCLGDEYQFELAGIVSWGVQNKCGIVNQPGVYTNVATFSDWINTELSKNSLK